MFAASLVVKGSRHLLVVGVALVLLTSFWPWRFPLSEFLHNKLVWEFLYGVLLGWCYARRLLPLNMAVGCLLAIVGIFLIVSFSPQYRAIAWRTGAMLIVFGTICFEGLATRLKFLTRLGDFSYSTYLAHIVVWFLLVDVYQSIGRPDLWPAFLVTGTIAILAQSASSFDFFESRASVSLQRMFLPPKEA